ncbi:MAG: sigma-54 dependent transcriptional regulator [Planctomycetota bacterium]|nr:sigma-54 dependent transcriptional regulator [Planctomycetota bacterium]
MMARILVVDDKELMRDSVGTMLSRRGHTVVAAGSGAAAIERIAQRPVDVVVSDLQMPGMDGLELMQTIRERDDSIPVILMTAFATIETAVGAMKNGAWDYITKPFSGDDLLATVERAVAHAKILQENQVLKVQVASRSASSASSHDLVGGSDVMNELRSHLRQVADSHSTVLICGESGTGKEVAARWIHANSRRASDPFLAINCAALSTSLLESELFGHEKGAFTGADRLRKGRFELADGGTLLLDEISEISPDTQAKLLRVLQERTFERVGSSEARAVDVRIIATSNRDLQKEIEADRFRQDLFFRLNVLPLNMISLRHHVDDIPDLADHFLRQVALREGRDPKKLSMEALACLQGYEWPGNVRELENICERAAVLADQEVIKESLVAPWIRNLAPGLAQASRTEVAGDNCRRLEEVERDAIVATLRRFNGHRQRSATALGIGVRTLGLKLKKWKEAQLVSASL